MRVSRGKRAFMWVATVLFSLVGALMLAIGPDVATRLYGVASLLMFGLGGAWYLRFTRKRPAPEPEGAVDRSGLLGMSEPALELPMRSAVSRTAVFTVATLLGAALVAIGV